MLAKLGALNPSIRPTPVALDLPKSKYKDNVSRNEWMAEEDPVKAALMFRHPQLALSYLAPKYKELEPDMEAQFWGSRYAR